jgi:hypothetical protein
MAPGQDFTYSTNLYYALPFTTNIFCGTNGADSARDSYIVIWNKINHNFQFQSDSIAGLNWALTNFMGTNVTGGGGSQTPVLQDVDWQTHFATNLSGICGPGGAFDPTLGIVGTPPWYASGDGTWGFGAFGEGVYGYPNTIVFQAANIEFPPSLNFAQPTFYGPVVIASKDTGVGIDFQGTTLVDTISGSVTFGSPANLNGNTIQDSTAPLNFYGGAATIDSSGNVVAASFADPAGDSLTANILTLNSTAVIGPDSGGNGGTTLMLQASDNGVPMYLHVTSLGVATWTTSP